MSIFLERTMIALSAILVWFLLINPSLPQLEARLFPVVSKMNFEEVEWDWDDPSKTAVEVEFNKRRACEFITLAWYVDDRWVNVEFSTRRGTRPPGNNRVGPWVIHAEDLDNSRVMARHRCHRWWDTWTQMYP
jgi:hypothetical protein